MSAEVEAEPAVLDGLRDPADLLVGLEDATRRRRAVRGRGRPSDRPVRRRAPRCRAPRAHAASAGLYKGRRLTYPRSVAACARSTSAPTRAPREKPAATRSSAARGPGADEPDVGTSGAPVADVLTPEAPEVEIGRVPHAAPPRPGRASRPRARAACPTPDPRPLPRRTARRGARRARGLARKREVPRRREAAPALRVRHDRLGRRDERRAAIELGQPDGDHVASARPRPRAPTPSRERARSRRRSGGRRSARAARTPAFRAAAGPRPVEPHEPGAGVRVDDPLDRAGVRRSVVDDDDLERDPALTAERREAASERLGRSRVGITTDASMAFRRQRRQERVAASRGAACASCRSSTSSTARASTRCSGKASRVATRSSPAPSPSWSRGTSSPVRPSSTASVSPPIADAITGTPRTIDSTATRPSGSSHCDGTTVAHAVARIASRSARSSQPWTVTLRASPPPRDLGVDASAEWAVTGNLESRSADTLDDLLERGEQLEDAFLRSKPADVRKCRLDGWTAHELGRGRTRRPGVELCVDSLG